MDQIEFIENLKIHGIDRNMALTKELLFEPINEKGDNRELIEFKKIFFAQNDEGKQVILAYLKQFMEDNLGIILSLLDGSSDIGVSGKFQLYYEQDGQRDHINNKEGDMLMTLLYDEDEDEA